ncbi:MAG: sialate O-acetylesterase [Verrucomicrobia bacterium]|nr:sialate O-acetylesterase [Verrucomicrobiota bacterium]
MMRPRFSLLSALWLLPAVAAVAEVKLPAIFSDNLVLQSGTNVPVWGRAIPGEEVTVQFAGQTKTAITDSRGKWLVRLDPLPVIRTAGELTVTSDDPLATVPIRKVKNVVVGEVWLGSGQSNMAMPVNHAENFTQEMLAANWPLIRMFNVTSPSAATAQDDCAGRWIVCTPGAVGSFSAVLYFFGREIHPVIDAPVGLINSSLGGSLIEQWTSAEAQAASAELRPYIQAQLKDPDKGGAEADRKKYELDLGRWAEESRRARAESKPAPAKPAHPLEARLGTVKYGGLFNGKIAPLTSFALRGIIWYQGEQNAAQGNTKAAYYQYQLPLIVQDWRARWGWQVPFATVQLPNFETIIDGRPLVREAALKSLSLPQTGMAITIDIGEANNNHPKYKQELGRRLSLWALATIYDRGITEFSGPLPAGQVIRGGEIELNFTHTEGGLVAKEGPLTGFFIAGANKQWKPAQARIAGKTVIVSSTEVPAPVAVRYAWTNNPTCNLVNGTGLPASPFRTDNWK